MTSSGEFDIANRYQIQDATLIQIVILIIVVPNKLPTVIMEDVIVEDNKKSSDPICDSKSDCHNHHCQIDESVHCSYGRCLCEATTSTEAATNTSFKNTAVTTPASSPPTTTLHITKTTNLLTTPDPTTVDPQLLIKCTNHTECSSHVCPVGKHPYCNFGQRSSDCQCTDCTDNSHCFCPEGLVGTCHFNYFDRSYSCVCGFPVKNHREFSLTELSENGW
uniref:Uncharacterized protein n=1 Tax=Magallana gigas TaxID=29159 RepID=K1QJG0_MAGGI